MCSVKHAWVFKKIEEEKRKAWSLILKCEYRDFKC